MFDEPVCLEYADCLIHRHELKMTNLIYLIVEFLCRHINDKSMTILELQEREFMYSVLGTQALVLSLLPTSEAKEYDTSLTGEHGVHMTVRKLMIARSHYVVHDLIKRGCGRRGSVNKPEQLRGTYSNVSI